jgi:glycosyltransferase AglI
MANRKQKISVIVPVYNDPGGLKNTLNSLVKQQYPTNLFEVIVADNGSTEKTLSLIDNFIARHPDIIRKVEENNIQSSYAARNKGIKKAQGEIMAFIDSDMTVKENWLRKIFNTLAKHNIDCLICNLQVTNRRNSIFALYDKMVAFPIEKYVKKSHSTPVGCMVTYKEIFNKVGFFDQHLISGGDLEFGNRIFEKGYKIAFAKDIVMKHPARETAKQLFSKHLRVGRGLFQLSYYYPKRYKKFTKFISLHNIMPTKPGILNRKWQKEPIWNQISLFQKLQFYLIDWGTKLAKVLGFLYERLKLSNK